MPARITLPSARSGRTFLPLLVGLQLLLAAVVIGGSFHNTRQQRENTLREHLIHAEVQVGNFEDHLTQSLYLVSLTLANLPEITGFDGSRKASAQHHRALEKIQRQMPALRSLSLASHDGHILASSVAANVGQLVDISSFLPVAPPQRSGLTRIGAPWEGRDFHDGHPSRPDSPIDSRTNVFFPLVLSLPDSNTGGLIAIAAINTDYFVNRSAIRITPELGHISVFDYNGRLLLSTDEAERPGSSIDDESLLQRALDEEIGRSQDKAHGRDMLTAFRASRNYPFFVVAHIDRDAALSKWRSETQTLLLLIGLALTGTLVVTGILTRRLVVGLAKEARMQEERRLAATVYEHSNDGIVVTDADTHILAVNPAFERITGYPATEALGQTPRLLSSGKHPPDFFTQMWESLQACGCWQGEIVNRHKDGNEFTEWLTITRIPDADGQTLHYVGVFKDVSETIQSEQTIRQLSMAVEQSPSSIVITTLEPAIEYVNPQFSAVTGYAADEVVGQNPRILQSKLTPLETYQAMWARLVAGENWEGEFINRRKDGSIYHERATVAPIKNHDGKIVRYLAIKHDITEYKRLEQALIEARDAAEASSRAKSEFLANMSHEIRTPMNGIIGMTQLALETDLAPAQHDLVTKAHSAAVSLLGILNDILDFSKIEAGKLTFESLPFDVGEMLQHLADIFEVAAREKGLCFTVSCDAGVPRHLVGDALRLSQILTNLIGNAIKFTPSGQICLQVTLGNAASDGNVTLDFSVTDTGIGMDAKQLDRLFQAFQQGDSSITRQYGGTGLGLAISQRLAMMMGSRIDVTSTPGAGSRFSFSVCLPRASEVPVTLERTHGDERFDLAGLAVLLVEDNPINQQLARTFLERAGITVSMADNGLEALARLETAAVDLVLMDVQMPVMDGLTATRRIRADARHHHLPIIAITAHAMTDDRDQCLAAGMQDYLPKPLDVGQLYAKIARWTGRRHQTPQPAPAPKAEPDAKTSIAPARAADDPLAERQAAIARIGGDEAIYHQVLMTFCEDHAHTAQNLRAQLLAANLAAAKRTAHTLKGLAATIGATGLFEAAQALDRALKTGTLPADWPTLMDALADRLSDTFSAARQNQSTSTDSSQAQERR